MRHGILYYESKRGALTLARSDESSDHPVTFDTDPDTPMRAAARVLRALAEEGWIIVGTGGTVAEPFWTLQLGIPNR